MPAPSARLCSFPRKHIKLRESAQARTQTPPYCGVTPAIQTKLCIVKCQFNGPTEKGWQTRTRARFYVYSATLHHKQSTALDNVTTLVIPTVVILSCTSEREAWWHIVIVQRSSILIKKKINYSHDRQASVFYHASETNCIRL